MAEYEDERVPKYHLTSKSPPWDPSTSLYSSQEAGMVDYRGRLIAKLCTNTHSPDMVANSVVSAAYTAVDITDNENFAAAPDHHIKVDMMSVVQTACLTTFQWKFAVDSDHLHGIGESLYTSPRGQSSAPRSVL